MKINNEIEDPLGWCPTENLNKNPNALNKRLMGIDFGLSRIGIALTDLLLGFPSPLETYNRKNENDDLNYIAKIAKDNNVKTIVFGLPLNMDGTISEITKIVIDFAEKLSSLVESSIEFEDERLTSLSAEEYLNEIGIKRKKIRKIQNWKSLIDKTAACLILKQFLERKKIETNKIKKKENENDLSIKSKNQIDVKKKESESLVDFFEEDEDEYEDEEELEQELEELDDLEKNNEEDEEEEDEDDFQRICDVFLNNNNYVIYKETNDSEEISEDNAIVFLVNKNNLGEEVLNMESNSFIIKKIFNEYKKNNKNIYADNNFVQECSIEI